MQMPQKLLICILMTFMFLGCGQASALKVFPVTGVVICQGNPLGGATIMFIPEDGPRAIGLTDDAGRYSLTTNDPNDGAAAGSYRVVVSKVEGANSQNIYASRRSLIKSKYGSVQTSGLSADVKPEKNTCNFELE